MKKVLLIAYAIPSRGSYRSPLLAKYLGEFGWQPTVLAGPIGMASNAPFRIIETPYRDPLLARLYRRLFMSEESAIGQSERRFDVGGGGKYLLDFSSTLARAILYYPDASKGWKPFALGASKELIETESIEAIISHSPPVTGHIVASELKAGYNIPWIADLPDLWSQNHSYRYGPLRKRFDTRLERKTLSGADALVTSSQPWADKLKELHKEKAVHVILHGFDPAEVNIPPVKLTTKFTVTYTGAVHRKHNPSKLLVALRDLISDGVISQHDIEVRFYGPRELGMEKEIEQYGLSSIVKQHGIVPKELALQKQKVSQLLILLNWDDPREPGGYSGKVFDYLGARRPILAIGGSKGDVVAKLLAETKAGIHAPTVEDVKSALKQLYQEYKLKGELTYKGEETEINKYSHREMARRFAELLNSITRK